VPVFLAWLRNGNLKLWDIHLHREEIQDQLLNQIWEVVVLVGPHNTQRASDAAPSPKRVTRESCRDIKGMPDQDVENKRHKKSIIMGDEVKQKSKGKEAMDECHTIKKQPDKVQHTRLLLCTFFIHTPPIS